MSKKVVVRHFHAGNDKDHSVRGTAEYATQARIVDLETGEYNAEEFWAYCSPRDNPSRRLGRSIALGRLYIVHPEFRPMSVGT